MCPWIIKTFGVTFCTMTLVCSNGSSPFGLSVPGSEEAGFDSRLLLEYILTDLLISSSKKRLFKAKAINDGSLAQSMVT
jgi:hypothetical protein